MITLSLPKHFHVHNDDENKKNNDDYNDNDYDNYHIVP